MGTAKDQTAISRVLNLLAEWDKGSKAIRKALLKDFIKQNKNKTGPELEAEFAQAASLFLTRITASLRLTYMTGIALTEHLQAVNIFISASSGHKFLGEFLEVGGILTVLEIIGLKQAREIDKLEALTNLSNIAEAGRKFKELICESYGIRAIAECLAKSKSEQTQDAARNLLEKLARGNPKFENQVYKGLIALLPCSSPKAQQMAAHTLRIVQPIVEKANPNIVDPLLNLLRTLHLEVQYEALELIKELMEYEEVKELIPVSLVKLLRPSKEDRLRRPQEILEDPEVGKLAEPLPVFVQQAASAKCIGILCHDDLIICEKFLQLQVVHHLMFAMGNTEYADSQRQASLTLERLCRNFPLVDESVKEAMGDILYTSFMKDPEALYASLTPVQADVLVSNKLDAATKS
ncbi:DgyrCDS14218 [Dimorphilus gyrociliatus]|uniref:DgyrCDS14218 n=1 Tax=Dimorphilus gyrociliatus TaxID=2664684 RepID=A0A7I8WCY8_9ANNE|nr:DgyrCDS14218 [Dimorphilus gyrociliatus]